jgi:hypothetical protein
VTEGYGRTLLGSALATVGFTETLISTFWAGHLNAFVIERFKDVKPNAHVNVEEAVTFGAQELQVPIFLLQGLFGDVLAAVMMEGSDSDNFLTAILSTIGTVELKLKIGDWFKFECGTAAFGTLGVVDWVVYGGAAPETDGRFTRSAAAIDEGIYLKAHGAFVILETLQVFYVGLHKYWRFAHLLEFCINKYYSFLNFNVII